MTKRGLPPEEVKKRLIRLRNLEYLHEAQRFKIWHLRDENRELKKEIKALKLVASEQQKTIDDLKLQIEELRVMVFGRKKKDRTDDDTAPPKEFVTRSADSYKRPVPKDEEVTEIIPHPLTRCVCGTPVTETRTVVFYEEDLPIPAKKVVRKHVVETGHCVKCKKRVSVVPLPNHKVVLGRNTQKYICYLSVMCRLSFTQIQNALSDTYALPISQGEIAKILARESVRLKPFFERLKVKIRGEPGVHLDETGWKLLCSGESSYAWVMSGAESNHLVLKRKISFGSLTKRTAERLAVLVSVLFSLKQRYQSSFFREYLRV